MAQQSQSQQSLSTIRKSLNTPHWYCTGLILYIVGDTDTLCLLISKLPFKRIRNNRSYIRIRLQFTNTAKITWLIYLCSIYFMMISTSTGKQIPWYASYYVSHRNCSIFVIYPIVVECLVHRLSINSQSYSLVKNLRSRSNSFYGNFPASGAKWSSQPVCSAPAQ